MNTEQRHVLHVFSVSVYFDFIFLFTFLHCTIGRRHILPIFLLLFFLEKLIPIFPPLPFSARRQAHSGQGAGQVAGERKQPNLHEMRAFFLGPEHSLLLDAPSSFHGDHRYTTSLDLRVERHEKEGDGLARAAWDDVADPDLVLQRPLLRRVPTLDAS